MKTNNIINIISEANLDAEVKILCASINNYYSLDSADTVASVRIKADALVAEESKNDAPYTVANLLGALNAFKSKEFKVLNTRKYPNEDMSIDGIVVTDKIVYLFVNEAPADETN